MSRQRRFLSTPPLGWITKQQLLAEAALGERTFDGWAEKLGLRTCLVSHGRAGITSYYPPGTVGTIKRLHGLRTHSNGNMDDWIWQLWLEEHDVDVGAWASMHLTDGLKRLGRRSTKAYRFIFDRILKQPNRVSLRSYADSAAAGRAGPDRETSLHNADPPIFDLIVQVAGLPANTKLPSGELKKVEHRWSLSHLKGVLDTATDAELEQARRDCRTIGGWVARCEAVDWNTATPELEEKIRGLTGAKPLARSILARKAERKRPLQPPIPFQALCTFWSALAVRPMLIPFLIELRRSPLIDFLMSIGAVMLDEELKNLPRKSAREAAE